VVAFEIGGAALLLALGTASFRSLRNKPCDAPSPAMRWLGVLFWISLALLLTASVAANQIGRDADGVYIAGFRNGDAGVFLSAGRFLAEGLLPYRDFWDHKWPIAYFANAIGALATPGSYSVFAATSMALLIAAGFAWTRSARVLGAAPASARTLVAAALGLLVATNLGWQGTMETLAFSFGACALWLALRAHGVGGCALAGALAALAFLTKHQIAADAAAVAILAWQPGRRGAGLRLAACALGGAAVLGVLAVTLVGLGVGREAWECFLFNFGYAAERRPWALAPKIALVAPLAIAAVGLAGIARLPDSSARSRGTTIAGLLAWILTALYAATLGHPHDHYLIVLWNPALMALAWGAGSLEGIAHRAGFGASWRGAEDALAAAARRLGGRGLVAASVAFAVLAHVGWSIWLFRPPRATVEINERFESLETAFVFAAQGGRYWPYLEQRPASRYFYLAPLRHAHHRDAMLAEIESQLERVPPDLILIERDLGPYERYAGYRELRDWLERFARDRYQAQALSSRTFAAYVRIEEFPGAGASPR